MSNGMPLEGVRVVDLTRYTAGPFCTRVLADYGADVIKIEQPGSGDPARSLPPFAGDEPGLERSGQFLFLNTNKRSVELDLKSAAGREQLLGLVRDAAVLVENFRPGTVERLGLGYEALRDVNPRLVMTSISNFGQSGPFRDFAGTDLTLFGMGGAMLASGDADHEPLKTAGRMTGYHAGYVAALATAIGLRAAEQRGAGEWLDISIYETASHSIDQRLMRLLNFQYNGRTVTRPPRSAAVGAGVFPCRDGYVLLSSGPARLPDLLAMIGHSELLEQPEWATAAARSHPDRVAQLDEYLLPWLAQHTPAEFRDRCQQFGVLGGPLNTIADLLADPGFRARDFFQEIDHPSTGPVRYPGYHFKLHRTRDGVAEPMPARRRAPLLGEHTQEVLAELPPLPVPRAPAPPAPAPAAASTGGRLPLEGVRILDFTVVWAGPYATMQLADWGAEVIRVESLQHFAPSTRGLLARPPRELLQGPGAALSYPDDEPGERPWNRAALFNCHARNKKSMTVDLTRPEGQEVLRRLVEVSDGLVENNLPPNIEKQGVSWERLSAINPRLIMVRIPGLGLDGPYRGYRTMGNHMEALAGHHMLRAYPHLGLEYSPSSVPSDAASGIGSAFAFTMGLRHRERTGEGLQIELATAENFVALMGEYVMDYTMNGRSWERTGNEHWTLAPHNVYRCAGEDRWVTIAVRTDAEWRALCAVMQRPELATDPRFAEQASRHAHREPLDALIGAWTADREPYWVMDRLQRAGVPAGVVQNESDILHSRQHEARGFFQQIAHPEAGTHQHVGRAWRGSESPPPAATAPPLLGEHNEYVYRELLGFTADEYRRLEEHGHIGMDYDPSVP